MRERNNFKLFYLKKIIILMYLVVYIHLALSKKSVITTMVIITEVEKDNWLLNK